VVRSTSKSSNGSLQLPPDLRVNGERMREDFEALAQIGATPEGGITRMALSTEDLQARNWFAERVDDTGLSLRDDDAGNLSAVLPAPRADARTLLIGSHLDTVPNGGRYDGSIGLVAGLECLRTIREANLRLPVHMEVIDLTDDEGCWKGLFGARALAGALSMDDLSDSRSDNASFRAALTRAGITPRQVGGARRASDSLAGYFELHVEHGSRLERADTSVGVVTGIVGRRTYRVAFHGEAGHSGTTDMYKRRDALRGAALFIVRAHDLVRDRFGDGIFNCGNVEVEPGAFNIIPSDACLTIEIRHVNAELMQAMETALLSVARECAASYALTVDIRPQAQMPAATMAAGVIQAIEQSADTLGLSHTRLISYAGHSAQVISAITPSGMIFVPSVGGIGHHPSEFTPWEDVVDGANVLLHAVLTWALREEHRRPRVKG
jgi:N-carbamoyl-L-amino-acid hydrolase